MVLISIMPWLSSHVDVFGLSASDSFLQIVPMCHANGWGLPHNVPMVGGKLVLPGPFMDGKSLFDLMDC